MKYAVEPNKIKPVDTAANIPKVVFGTYKKPNKSKFHVFCCQKPYNEGESDKD